MNLLGDFADSGFPVFGVDNHTIFRKFNAGSFQLLLSSILAYYNFLAHYEPVTPCSIHDQSIVQVSECSHNFRAIKLKLSFRRT
jgi:hypothetical protein